MDNDSLEHRLALVERQIVDAERHITLRRDILNGLDVNGLGASDTADAVRDLLRHMEDKLRAHTAERKRLQAQLRRQLRAAVTATPPYKASPCGGRTNGAGGFFLPFTNALSSATVSTRPTASGGSLPTEARLARWPSTNRPGSSPAATMRACATL